MSSWHTLVDAATLSAAMASGRSDLVLVDCRFSLADPDAGRAAYRQGHLPGAHYAHLGDDLSGAPDARAGRHPWPESAAFTALLERWDVAPGSQVVAYDDGDGAFASRLWFLLVAMGHDHVAVLDGGLAAWHAAGLAVQPGGEAAGTHGIEPSRRPAATVNFDMTRLVDAAQVQARLDRGGLLLDARAAPRFRGDVEPIDPVAGHVPGATNRPYAENLQDGRFKPAAQLRAEFLAVLGAREPDDVVVMCGSGVTACHHLLAMAHAGLPGAQLYGGSWSGWISDPARPVAVGGQG